jgi:hypothetical protein
MSSPRYNFIKSQDSILDLFVFVPMLLVQTPNPLSAWYSFVIISRFMRIMIYVNMLSKYHALGESDVER